MFYVGKLGGSKIHMKFEGKEFEVKITKLIYIDIHYKHIINVRLMNDKRIK